MPNLIHSLDASSLTLLIDNLFKENPSINFYSVHDCFAVTCNKVQKIMDILKVIYYNTYSKDQYLRQFDTDVFDSILKHYGESCYDPKTKIITISVNIDPEKSKILKLSYPNVNDVIANDKLNIQESSYIIH